MSDSSGDKVAPGTVNFDWTHVEQAVAAIAGRDEGLAASLDRLPATAHLVRHATLFGRPVSAPELTRRLIFPLSRHEPALAPVVAALRLAQREAAEASDWLTWVTRLLPRGSDDLRGTTLYATYGYDIGVVSDGWSASVNLAHPRVTALPTAFRFYAIHELHHAAYLRRHHPPDFSRLNRRARLKGAIRYLTQLEGLGVYAPWAARRAAGALNDPDYAVLEDEGRIGDLERRFRHLYQELDSLSEVVSDTVAETTLERFGSPDKLFHLVGCRMAAGLMAGGGLEALVSTVAEGPDSFFARCGLD